MKLYVINGISLAGKDSFYIRVNRICKNFGLKTNLISTIDPVKEIYKNFFGWNGEKTDEDRQILNDLKQLWIKKSNGPLNWLIKQIEANKQQNVDALFVMVREYEELIQTIKAGKEFCEDAKSIVIKRNRLHIPPVEQKILNTFPNSFKYDIAIYNITTRNPKIPRLWDLAKKFVIEEF